MTLTEQYTEVCYRRAERIAIMCEDGPITPEAEAEADKDAAQWSARYLRENPRDGQLGMNL